MQKCWSVDLGVTHSQKDLNSKFPLPERVLNFFQVWLESMEVYKYAKMKIFNFALMYRMPQKKVWCFMISISIKLNTNMQGIYLIWKVGSIVPSGVQKYFWTILESRDIRKTIWCIRCQELYIMKNLIILKSDTTRICVKFV